MKFNIFLDATQTTCYIAVFNGDGIYASLHRQTNNNMTEVVVEMIEDLLFAKDIKKTDIIDFYVTNGPGSFTGVRVGLLIAQAWRITQGSDIYVISSLLLQLSNGTGASALDARGDKFYYARYKDGNEVIKPELVSLEFIKKNETDAFCYGSVDVFKNLLFHFQEENFKKQNTPEFVYVKEAVKTND